MRLPTAHGGALSVGACAVISAVCACAQKQQVDLDMGMHCDAVFRECHVANEPDGAEGLPRVTERDWSPEAIQLFLRRASQSTVAVERATATRVLPDCRLDGAYVEVRGEAGSGRFWATNRPLFATHEIGPDCAGATHAVAAYVTHGQRFEGILVPLPCPPTSDTSPARVCIARDMTGPERQLRAQMLEHKWEPDIESSGAPGQALQIYALAPDDPVGLSALGEIRKDCVMSAHASWVRAGYQVEHGSRPVRRPVAATTMGPTAGLAMETPRIDREWAARTCLASPVFLTAFPELFVVDRQGGSCWLPAKAGE
jgi:hypothetical protein